MIDYLLKDKAKIFAHDPIAIENSNKVVNNHINLKFITNWEEKIATVDAIIVATTWTEYKKLASTDLQNVLVGKVLFDVRRFFIPSNFPKSVYLTIGRSIDF